MSDIGGGDTGGGVSSGGADIDTHTSDAPPATSQDAHSDQAPIGEHKHHSHAEGTMGDTAGSQVGTASVPAPADTSAGATGEAATELDDNENDKQEEHNKAALQNVAPDEVHEQDSKKQFSDKEKDTLVARTFRLTPLKPTEIPAHPRLESLQSSQTELPALKAFVLMNLRAALHLTDKHMQSSTFKIKTAPKHSPPSSSPVRLLSSDTVPGSKETKATWFARRSVHEDAAKDGTASWAEFENGLLYSHSQNEAAYTPDIYDSRCVLDWKDEVVAVDEGKEPDGFEGFSKINVSVWEMAHKLPMPLSRRVFATLVITAKDGEHSFIVVQMPVDLSQVNDALYSNGQNRQNGDTAEKREKVVIGVYSSVERVKKADDGRIVWEMATASDAKGMLPMGIQKMGIPGAVAKDVGFFIGWSKSRRT